MKIYHSTDPELTDAQARKMALANQRTVEAAGGEISVSKSFTYGPAIVVLQLPDDVSTESLLPGVGFKEFTEEAANGAQE